MTHSTISDYLTEEQPLGPTVTPVEIDVQVFELLFDVQNEIYREMHKDPSLIVGRRGSGKTAFLRSARLEKPVPILVDLEPSDVFGSIIRSIEDMSVSIVFVEQVSALWNMLLWTTVLKTIADTFPNQRSDHLQTISRFLVAIGVKGTMSPYRVIRTTINTIKKSEGNLSTISELVEELLFDDVTFADAKDAALDFMRDNNLRAIILMDSLEDFKLDKENMAHALAGLLRCVGQFRTPGAPCDVRFCLPSELYHLLMRISANPSKDFERHQLIHWHAGELMHMAARRYSAYLELTEPDYYDEEVRHLDLDLRADVGKFWWNLFPHRISNGLGGVEDSIAYILRHTQLLPRHLLLYLNGIMRKNHALGGSRYNISEQAITEGIKEREEMIIEEIFNGYKYVYPAAPEVCAKCIPHLPLHFPYGELHRVFNRHGKGIEGVHEFEDFLNILVEIGAVGRVVGETSRYIEGMFEYTVPHHLTVSSEDWLCLHPVFCEVFTAKKPKSGGDGKVIYPYGTDMHGGEYRGWVRDRR